MELCYAMRTFLLVVIGGAVCYNLTQSVAVSDVFWMTLVQLPTLQLYSWGMEVLCAEKQIWCGKIFVYY